MTDEIVTYETLLTMQDKALADLADGGKTAIVKRYAAANGIPVTDLPVKPVGIVVVAKLAPMNKGQRIAAKRQAAEDARIDSTLCKGHFTAKPVKMTSDRAEMHMASLRLEQRSGSRRIRRQFRRLGLSSLTLCRRELGLPKTATRDDVLAVLDKYVP